MIARAASVLATAAALPLAATMAFLVWAAPRGLDLTDEGLYLLGSQFPGEVTMSASSSYWFSAVLYRIAWRNVIAMRLLGLAVTFASGLVFYYGVRAALDGLARSSSNVGMPQRVAEASVVILGAMLGYVWFLPTPSYNHLNNWGLLIGCGCFFAALAKTGTGRPASAWMFASGACLAMLLLVKFPTAILLSAIFAVCLASWRGIPIAARSRLAIPLAAGAASLLAVFFVAAESPMGWVRTFRLGLWMSAAMGANHGLEILPQYLKDWREGILAAIDPRFWWAAGAILGLSVALAVAARARRSLRRVLAAAITLIIGYAALLSVTHLRELARPYYLFDVVRFHFTWLVLFGATVVAAGFSTEASGEGGARRDAAPSAGQRRGRVLLALVLFALPFAGAVGTNNIIYVGMTYTLGPWLALVVLLLDSTAGDGRNPLLRQAAAVMLACFCAVQIVGGAYEAPYRVRAGGLGQQTQVTEVGYPSTRLKLDPQLGTFLTDLRRLASVNGFRPGDDLIALFDMPGVVFALGGRSPGTPWFSVGYPGSLIVNERALTTAGASRVKQAFLLTSVRGADWLQGTRALAGIPFPEGYVLCGSTTVPFAWGAEDVRLWRPAQARPGNTAHLPRAD
jgi:hypothetical protein